MAIYKILTLSSQIHTLVAKLYKTSFLYRLLELGPYTSISPEGNLLLVAYFLGQKPSDVIV